MGNVIVVHSLCSERMKVLIFLTESPSDKIIPICTCHLYTVFANKVKTQHYMVSKYYTTSLATTAYIVKLFRVLIKFF